MGCINVRHKINAEKEPRERFRLKNVKLCMLPPSTNTVVFMSNDGDGMQAVPLDLSHNKLYCFSGPLSFQNSKTIFYSMQPLKVPRKRKAQLN